MVGKEHQVQIGRKCISINDEDWERGWVSEKALSSCHHIKTKELAKQKTVAIITTAMMILITFHLLVVKSVWWKETFQRLSMLPAFHGIHTQLRSLQYRLKLTAEFPQKRKRHLPFPQQDPQKVGNRDHRFQLQRVLKSLHHPHKFSNSLSFSKQGGNNLEALHQLWHHKLYTKSNKLHLPIHHSHKPNKTGSLILWHT